jgi:hypothetical protein
MGGGDAASRLRSIVGLQKEARGEAPPSLTLLPTFQQAALRAGQPPVTTGPHSTMLNPRAWKIWLQCNLLAVLLYFALVGSPKRAMEMPKVRSHPTGTVGQTWVPPLSSNANRVPSAAVSSTQVLLPHTQGFDLLAAPASLLS